MATVPLIFPSLSRQPSMDSSKSVDDDTIRDQMESGYVATRPRFTRARRTWKINVRNLQAEDVRALDQFFMATTARGASSFLYPNLLPNGSFEFPATDADDLVFGWNVSSGTVPSEAIGITATTVADGTQAIRFGTVAGQSVPAHTTVAGLFGSDTPVNCAPGEGYVFTASVSAVEGTLAAGVLAAQVLIVYLDSDGNTLSTASGPVAAMGGGFQAYSYAFTVPANAAQFTVNFSVGLVNSTGSALALDGSASVTLDAAGCALQTPLTPYGRMAGSAPLGCLVRFSSLPETSDVGWGEGVKRYGAHFEVTEV